MNCEQALEAISAKLDGQLSAQDNQELQAHLAQCPQCRALLEELLAMDLELKTLPCEPPQELARGVMDKIQAEQTAARRKKPFAIGFAALAAALLLAMGLSGTLPLPGLEDARASLSAKGILDAAFVNGFGQEAEASAEPTYAQSFAAETGAFVAVIRSREPLPQLEDRPTRQDEEGNVYYTLPVSEARELAQAHSALVYNPKSGEATAYVLLLP